METEEGRWGSVRRNGREKAVAQLCKVCHRRDRQGEAWDGVDEEQGAFISSLSRMRFGGMVGMRIYLE